MIAFELKRRRDSGLERGVVRVSDRLWIRQDMVLPVGINKVDICSLKRRVFLCSLSLNLSGIIISSIRYLGESVLLLLMYTLSEYKKS